MFPVIFKFGFIQIYSYGLMVAAAFLVSAFLLSRYARLLHYDKEFFWNFAFVILVGGILGGRLFYSILNFDFFLDNPQEIFMLWHVGLVWYGGFFGGLISASVYLKLKKKPFFKTADMVVPFVALGHAIGRIGCFLNGCCYGRVASWGVYFPVHNEVLIPSQLLSVLGLLAIFVILRLLQDRPHRDGFIVVAYLLCASLERFIEEYFRGDSPRNFYGLTVFQVLSAAIFFGAGIVWYMILRFQKKTQTSV